MNILPLIRQRTARVGVVGLGSIGLPLAIASGRAGFSVTGFEGDEAKRKRLDAGDSYISDVSAEDLAAVRYHFDWTTKMSRLANVNVVIVCMSMPDPRDPNPDLQPVEDTANIIARHVKLGSLILFEQNAWSDEARQILEKHLKKNGRPPGEKVFFGSTERPDLSVKPKPGDRAQELTQAFFSAIAEPAI